MELRGDYCVVFSRGGIIRTELGSRPKYLENYLASIGLHPGITKEKVRNDHIIYTSGVHNAYLIVFRDPEQEASLRCVLEQIKQHTESTPEGREVRDGAEPEEEAREEVSDEEASRWTWTSNPLFSLLRTPEITETQIREHLFNRNIPNQLSRVLAREIVRTKEKTQMLVSDREKLQASIRKVLAQMVPTRSPSSILAEIQETLAARKGPFVFCLIGVNGVGKSTTLSKICFWLLKNNLSVCVAACDGFRSGAVEQLSKYVERYRSRGHQITLYEKGYGKDEAGIASKAIAHAKETKQDVVVIDTCGRMPNNTRSMLSLSKMIRINKPSLVMYVGEALVGSDSVEQIRAFDLAVRQACVDKEVDGIVVTKCDAVGDKIGAIVSLAHSSAKPVVFIGTGQRNIDLLPLDIDNLVLALNMH